MLRFQVKSGREPQRRSLSVCRTPDESETESTSTAVQHTPGSVDVARITSRKVTLLLHWKSSCAKDTKTAPVHLQTSPRSREERSSDGEPQQKSLLFPNNEYLKQTSGQPQTSAPRTERTAQRGQLLPSALHSCLEEIQTSNPAFPVRAMFSILQKKTIVQESGDNDEQSIVSLNVHRSHKPVLFSTI